MCGFVGYMFDQPTEIEECEKKQLENMTDMIAHRGPDDKGYFLDNYVRFGFRRLSIIDVDGGHQPLSYKDDRYCIIYNGEIYNYLELRECLEAKGYTFRTNTDTEIIVALYSDKKEEALNQLRGMFSFLIWDKEKKELFGARDPFGIKPFYYLEEDCCLYCASEKKSILWLKENKEVNTEGLHHYLTYQFVPEPQSMSHHIQKLEPGHFFRKKAGEPIQIEAYWKPSFKPVTHPTDQQQKAIRDTLRESVRMHMRSDVPVGAFLSGGVDSSAIVALAKEFNPDIKTFTVGFEREGYSEIEIAKDTAEQLGVKNIDHVITPEEFMKELPKIIWHMDDPVADPAAVPLYFVAREARKHVKVVLSGEGADELFGGYNIYREPDALKGISELPEWAKRMLRAVAGRFPEGMKGKSFIERGTTPLERRFIGNAKLYSEKEKADLLKNHQSIYAYDSVTRSLYDQVQDYSDVHKMQYIDIHTWMRGDILVKADRMTMAHSLELRVPFLDQEVFRVASGLDTAHTVTNQTTKFALREAMRGIVPDSVLYNKKLGFPVPIRHWLKNELYEWAQNTIKTSPTDHLLNKSVILQQLEAHARGKRDYSRKLWAIVVFMLWHRLYVEQNIAEQSGNTNVLEYLRFAQ
jgi:asparagine synthase (glutamine-hydrolysing)